MTGVERSQWWRLMNPIATRRPPAKGSQPETVISVPPTEILLINDDWRDSARYGRIAIGSTDGIRQVTITLFSDGGPTDPDYLVFLAHPNRLWVRTLGVSPPVIGSWMADHPAAAVGAAEVRRKQKIGKARRKGKR